MAQDYTLQLENVKSLHGLLARWVEELQRFDSLYADMVELSLRDGLPVEMHRTLTTQYVERVHTLMRNLCRSIESEDMTWIKSLENGYEAAISASEASVAAGSVSAVTSSPAVSPVTEDAEPSKAERFRQGIHKVVTTAAVKAATDSGRDENQRDIHVDYLAALIANQKQH